MVFQCSELNGSCIIILQSLETQHLSGESSAKGPCLAEMFVNNSQLLIKEAVLIL